MYNVMCIMIFIIIYRKMMRFCREIRSKSRWNVNNIYKKRKSKKLINSGCRKYVFFLFIVYVFVASILIIINAIIIRYTMYIFIFM